jgi:hypothetical protein
MQQMQHEELFGPTLHHREARAGDVVHYLPLGSSTPQKDDPPRRTFSGLLAAALWWLFNEIVEGLAAYAPTIHPIVPPVSIGTLAGDESADQISDERRSNSQSSEAEGRREAYVTGLMVRSNACIPPKSGRGSR